MRVRNRLGDSSKNLLRFLCDAGSFASSISSCQKSTLTLLTMFYCGAEATASERELGA